VEVIFDQGCNELFVVRVAGNVLGVECLGSIDYAVRHLGSRLSLLVVLGHTGCGAITAAVDTYLNPREYADIAFTHALRSLVDRMIVAVRGSAKALERSIGARASRGPGFRTLLLETAIYLNAAVTAFDVRRELGGLGSSTLRVVYGVYDLVSQRVRALPAGKAGDGSVEPCSGDAPESAEELTDLSTRVVQRIRARSRS
jgi:carbonic anhydrase